MIRVFVISCLMEIFSFSHTGCKSLAVENEDSNFSELFQAGLNREYEIDDSFLSLLSDAFVKDTITYLVFSEVLDDSGNTKFKIVNVSNQMDGMFRDLGGFDICFNQEDSFVFHGRTLALDRLSANMEDYVLNHIRQNNSNVNENEDTSQIDQLDLVFQGFMNAFSDHGVSLKQWRHFFVAIDMYTRAIQGYRNRFIKAHYGKNWSELSVDSRTEISNMYPIRLAIGTDMDCPIFRLPPPR